MRLRILIGFIAISFCFMGRSYAGTATWTGGSSVNWSNGSNWASGHTPTPGDDVFIGGGTTFAPTVDGAFTIKSLTANSTVTLTLSALLSVTKTLSVASGTLTFAGSNAATFGGAGTINNTCSLIIGASNTITFNALLTVSAGGALTNNGILDINSGLTAGGSPSPIINTGTIAISGSTLDVEPGGSVTNTGTITTNAASSVLLNGNPSPINNNLNGVFNATSTAFTMAAGSSITNTGGTFTITSSTITCNGNPTPILNQNSGATTGVFKINATAITFNGTNSITNYGTFTVNNGSAITTTSSANTCSVTNYGTFYAGTSNSACTITYGLGSILKINNSATTVGATTYNGSFYLGSTSIIYPSVASSSITNASGCTFTLQSDIYGSASIAALVGTISGLYNVERYLSGGSSAYRAYRELSSPVYETTVGGNHVYSINYVKLSSLLTGSGGTSGGFDKSGNPTLYLYRDNIAYTNGSFNGGNFRGVANISTDPSYSIDYDGSGYSIPVGNGFLFFDRGDRTTNLANKYTPGTSAESVTLTASGTLNTGAILVKPWFSLLSTLDYTAVTGNSTVLGFAMVGNPYPSSINWDKFSTTTSTNGIYGPSVSPFIYVLDPVNGNYNVYQQGNGGTGTIAATGSNIIPSGQGFFVSALSSTASLTFNETGKTSAQATPVIGNLFLGAPPVASVSQFLRLNMVQDSVHTDGVIINFNSMAKQQFVLGEDAVYKTGSGPVSLSSMSADNVALAINSQALPKLSSTVIPLNVSAATNGTYQLRLTTLKSVPDLYDVWLKDAYNKDSLDIKHNPAYAFTITKSDTTSYGANRFSLVIRENPALMVHLLSFGGAKADGSTQLVWTTENEQNYTDFTVERSTDGGVTFNVLGGVPSSAIGTYTLLDKAPVQGQNAYRLKMTDLNGTTTYSSVVTIMYGNSGKHIATNNLSLYPNPTAGQFHLAITQNNQNNQNNNVAYTIQIVNNVGTVIKTATSNQPNWQTDVSGLVPGTYFVEVKNNSTNALVGKSGFVKL